MADPRDVLLVRPRRKRFTAGPEVTLDAAKRAETLWPLAASGAIEEGETIEVARHGDGGFLVELHVTAIDHGARRVVCEVRGEHNFANAAA